MRIQGFNIKIDLVIIPKTGQVHGCKRQIVDLNGDGHPIQVGIAARTKISNDGFTDILHTIVIGIDECPVTLDHHGLWDR